MAPRQRSGKELLAMLRSAPVDKVSRTIQSLSEKDRRILAQHASRYDGKDPLSKQFAALASLKDEDVLPALAALPKDTQEAILSKIMSSMDSAIAQGDHEAETLALGYREQLDHIYPRTTFFEHFMQEWAKDAARLGLIDRDIDKERTKTQAMVLELDNDWHILHRLLVPFEGEIQARWLKMRQSRKREVLLKAWPNIPERHRPDLTLFFGNRNNTRLLTENELSSMIYPYINSEDLLKPKALLMFLNSRGRHHPSNFAYSDLDLAPLSKTRKEYLVLFDSRYTMDFLGGNDVSSYGRWIEWKDETKALESIRAGRTVHFEHGTQILNIQVNVTKFLKHCALLILGDEIGIATRPACLEPPKLSDQVGTVEKMEIISREAPYRLPCHLDLPRLHSLVSSQRLLAIDHAWALREAPDYFVTTLEEYREHRNELILDQSGKLHPHASASPLYNKAARHMAADAHCYVFVWDELLQRIERVQSLMSANSSKISKEKDLPKALHEELAELRFFLEAIMLNALGDISIEVHASPPLRAYHYRANAGDSNLRKFDVRENERVLENPILKHLLMLKQAICDDNGRHCFTIHVLMDELERLLQSDSKAKAFVSSHITKSLSKVSIFAECLHHLHQFQPWAHKIENDIQDRKLHFAARYDEIFKYWGRINSTYQKFENKRLYRLCSPQDGKFAYPAHEQHSRSKVDKMRAAEAALDAFWEGANAHWMSVTGTTPIALVKHIMSERKLMRTEPWEVSFKTGKIPKSLQPSVAHFNAFSVPGHDANKQATGVFAKPDLPEKLKTKTKTKGVSAAQADGELALDVSTIELAPPVLKVNKRALKVFRALFHSPNSPNQPGEVAWQDLLHAMISVGFGVEKLRSSAWHFTPPPSIGQRAIQLHEPHPSKKLPFVLARHYGRRLNIAYQWTSGSFELA